MRSTRSAFALACALLLSGCGAFETAAAVVNGRKIDEERFRHQLEYFAADPRFVQQFPGTAGETEKKNLARQLLTFLVHQQLIAEYAEGRSIGVREQDVDARLADRVEEAGGDEGFRAQLRRAGVTVGEVRGLVEAQLLREIVARMVVEEELPDTELQQTYESRLTEFTEVRAAHILVEDRALADDLRGRATPENFARLAERFSTDPGSAPEGGDLGTRPAAEYVPPFDQAVLDIPVGEIGGPIETEFGFHVIYVLERTSRPFEEVREQLLAESGEEFFNGWLLDRLRTAEVLVNPRYGVLDERTGQVVERRTTESVGGPVQLAP